MSKTHSWFILLLNCIPSHNNWRGQNKNTRTTVSCIFTKMKSTKHLWYIALSFCINNSGWTMYDGSVCRANIGFPIYNIHTATKWRIQQSKLNTSSKRSCEFFINGFHLQFVEGLSGDALHNKNKKFTYYNRFSFSPFSSYAIHL